MSNQFTYTITMVLIFFKLILFYVSIILFTLLQYDTISLCVHMIFLYLGTSYVFNMLTMC